MPGGEVRYLSSDWVRGESFMQLQVNNQKVPLAKATYVVFVEVESCDAKTLDLPEYTVSGDWNESDYLEVITEAQQVMELHFKMLADFSQSKLR
jgi:hypothetical protein